MYKSAFAKPFIYNLPITAGYITKYYQPENSYRHNEGLGDIQFFIVSRTNLSTSDIPDDAYTDAPGSSAHGIRFATDCVFSSTAVVITDTTLLCSFPSLALSISSSPVSELPPQP